MPTAHAKHVTKRAGSSNYYVRMVVPLHLQPLIGKKEVWRSLGTSDLRQAKAKAHRVIVDIQDEWARKMPSREAAGRPIVEPPRAELEAAAARYYEQQIEADLDERLHDPEFVRQFYEKKRFKKAEKELARMFAIGDYSAIDVDYWAETFGFRFNSGSLLRQEFAQLLLRAELEATRRFADHDSGNLGRAPQDAFFLKSADTSVRFNDASSPGAATPTSPTYEFDELFELHREHLSDNLKEDTLEQRSKSVRRFAEYVGRDADPSKVTKAMARDWRNALRRWPRMADQRHEFQGLSFNEVLERNEALGIPSISARTRAKYVSEVSAFFTWMRREGYVEQNVFDDLHETSSGDGGSSRTFSDDQLKRLFSSPLFVGAKGDNSKDIYAEGPHLIRDWRFWLPILAAFSGARQGELAQLELSDLGQDGEIHFMRITNRGEDPLKSLKNAYSRRSLPIHSRVLDLGFLRYVESVRAKKQNRLFPEISRDNRGAFADVSKFYQKYFKQIGLNTEMDRRVVFHSFRHRFTDELRRNYTEDQIKPLLGHSGKTTTGGYGEREALSLPVRKEMIETVAYEMVDWTRLAGATSRQ